MLSPGSLLSCALKPPKQVSPLLLTTQHGVKCDDDHWCKHLFPAFCLPVSVSSAIKEFVLIPQHTTPTNTTKELDALYDVLQHVRKMWKTDVGSTTSNYNTSWQCSRGRWLQYCCVFGQDVMLLGDFNADCGYLPRKNRKNVRMITEKNLYWLIPEKTDTTVRLSTSCAYDRWARTPGPQVSLDPSVPLLFTKGIHKSIAIHAFWIHTSP